MKEIVVCSGAAVTVDGVPEEVKILPLGYVNSQKGDFYVDDESVELIQKQFKNRRLDLPIDYEHQTLMDVQAPAAGWIRDVYKGDDAVIAKVSWTERAREYLKNREYRYLSPVVITRKSDRKVLDLHSAALTNTPAIDGMFAIVNSMDLSDMEDDFDDKEDEEKMDLKKLAALLGLPEGATEDDVEKAITAAVSAAGADKSAAGEASGEETKQVANSVVLSLLGLDESAKTEDAVTAIMTLKAGTGNEELLALKKEMEERAADDLVQTALKDGKITAAQTDWAKSYAVSDREGFKAFVAKAPVVVPQGKMDLKDAPGSGGDVSVDVKILKNCGLTQEDIKKYYREDTECTE